MASCEIDEGNRHDTFAVKIVKSGLTVGHVPMYKSKIFNFFLRRGGKIEATVTGERENKGVGLQLPCGYKFIGAKKDVYKLKKLL